MPKSLCMASEQGVRIDLIWCASTGFFTYEVREMNNGIKQRLAKSILKNYGIEIEIRNGPKKNHFKWKDLK